MAKWLIDANALWDKFNSEPWYNNADRDEIALWLIDNAPTVDAVEVVRCHDCRYAKFESKCSKYYCLHFPECLRYANDFCSYGKRKVVNANETD